MAEQQQSCGHASLSLVKPCCARTLDSLLAASPDLFHVLDRDLCFCYVDPNSRLPEYTGLPREALIGRPMDELRMPGSFAAEALEVARRVQAHGTPQRGSARWEVPGRPPIIWEFVASPVHAPSGELDGVVMLSRDISELRNTRAQLARSEELLRVALEAGRLAHWAWEPASGRLYWSESVTSRLQRAVPLRNAADLQGHYAPEDWRALCRLAGQAAEEGTAPFAELPVRLEGGQWRYWEHRLLSWQAPADGERLVVVTVHDVTERAEAERELRAARDDLEAQVQQRTRQLQARQDDLQHLLHIISHDLRQPLRAIRGFADLLAEHEAETLTPEGRGYLERIEGGAARLDALVDDLHQLSKLHAAEAERETLGGRELLALATGALQSQIEASGAKLHIAEAFPSYRVHRLWSVHAVANLLGNALKFHGDTPPEVAVRPLPESPSGPGIQVLDRGPGVPDAQRERIFEMFCRGTNSAAEGTGAGLAIVRKVAQLHGGHAWVEPRPGGGSVFTITFGPAG